MTKQEEIREGAAKWLASVIENGEPYDDFATMEWSELAGGEEMADGFRGLADSLFVYQDSQGVVIRVDRELPRNLEVNLYYGDGGFIDGQEALDEASYVAVEPLIKEVNNENKLEA